MNIRTASVVTLTDLFQYFTGVENNWGSDVYADGEFRAHSGKKRYEVQFRPETTLFHLHIESVDDPADTYDITTDEPIREMAKFLGKDVPGADTFEKMVASGPRGLHTALVQTASLVRARDLTPDQTISVLRRLVAAALSNKIVPRKTAGRETVDIAEIPALRRNLEKKGWRVVEHQNDAGVPVLEVDISGIYEATIAVDSVEYTYSLQVVDEPSSKENGVTNDPIEAYEKWTKKPETKEARERQSVDSLLAESPTIPVQSPDKDKATVAPPKRPSTESYRETRKSPQ